MISNVLTSTKTLTGRLAVFFGLMALIVSAFVYVVFITALYLSEDRVGERRILIDRNYAVGLFQSGESGELRIDDLTIAYNDLSYLPKKYLKYIEGKENFIGEVGEDPESRMVYVGEYTHEGRTHPIVLLSEIDRVELSVFELVYATTFVLALLSILIFSFGALLYRLSKRLIEPFNSLSEQLESNKLNLNEEFGVNDDAAVEFRQLTDQLNQYRREINSLVKREQAFARYSSHELRTPMTSIRAFSEILRDTGDLKEEELHRYASVIHDEALRLTRLLNDLLDLSVLESGQVSLNMREGRLSDVLDHAVSAALAGSEPRLKVIREPGGEALQLNSDLDRLAQVFINLIANAEKYCDATAPHLTITVHNSDGLLTIDFVDNGSGIPPEAQSMVFEKFARVSAEKAGGAGLGLAICREIMERLGGSITYLNERNGGAFRVALPTEGIALAAQ